MINNTFSFDGGSKVVELVKVIINNGMRTSFKFFIFFDLIIKLSLKIKCIKVTTTPYSIKSLKT